MEGVDGRAEWPWMKVTNMNKGRGEGNYAPQIRESIPTAKSERGRTRDASVHNRQTFLTALVAAAAGRSGANNAFASFRSRLHEGRKKCGPFLLSFRYCFAERERNRIPRNKKERNLIRLNCAVINASERSISFIKEQQRTPGEPHLLRQAFHFTLSLQR